MNGNQGFYLNCKENEYKLLAKMKTNMLRTYPLPKGVTLFELMIAMAIVSVLLVAFQTPIQIFNRVIFTKQVESDLRMNVQRFQLVLKNELTQAGYAFSLSEDESKNRNAGGARLGGAAFGSPNGVSIINGVLSLQADLNLDGDIDDSKERIYYRFDENKQALLRKSGNGYFQKFMGGIQSLNFSYLDEKSSEGKVCLRLMTQVLEQIDTDQIIICQIGV